MLRNTCGDLNRGRDKTIVRGETDAEVLGWDSGDETDSLAPGDEEEFLEWHMVKPVDAKVSEAQCLFCENWQIGSEFGSRANCGQIGRLRLCSRSGLCPECWGTIDEPGLIPPAGGCVVTRSGGLGEASRPKAEDQERRLASGARRSMRCKHTVRGLVLGARVLIGLLIFTMVYVSIHGAQHGAREGMDVQTLVTRNTCEALLVLNQSHPNGRLQLERGFNCRGFGWLSGKTKSEVRRGS